MDDNEYVNEIETYLKENSSKKLTEEYQIKLKIIKTQLNSQKLILKD